MNKSKRRNNYKNRIKHATTKTKKNKKGNHQNKNENNSKRNKNIILLKNRTPKNIQHISKQITTNIDSDDSVARGRKQLVSYAPSINEELVSLKSMPRATIVDCNTIDAFQLKKPLKISIPGSYFGRKCVPYDSSDARKFLLNNLQANKHVDFNKVIPPKQLQANCWFNAMFVTIFVSDKGRKFFHYFRQLMIEGKQIDGTPIPKELRDAFALLNFAVESSLTGSKYAYNMDTNSVIKKIYDSIPSEYHVNYKYLVDVDSASNPIKYYNSIVNYLGNHSLDILFIQEVTDVTSWNKRISQEMSTRTKIPHMIILEIYDPYAKQIKDKPIMFSVNKIKYSLDSSVVRDIQKQHFCATITCEGKEMGYDGLSFHRLVPMKWKDKLNKPIIWQFQGSNNLDGTPLEWSFRAGYQLLLYFRV